MLPLFSLPSPGPFNLYILVQCKRQAYCASVSFTRKWPCSSPRRRLKHEERPVGLLRRKKSHLPNDTALGDQPREEPPIQARRARSTCDQKTRKQLIRKLAIGSSQSAFAPHSLSTILNIKFKCVRVCPLS